MWELPGPGIEPVSPALEGECLTIGTPGKSAFHPFCILCLSGRGVVLLLALSTCGCLFSKNSSWSDGACFAETSIPQNLLSPFFPRPWIRDQWVQRQESTSGWSQHQGIISFKSSGCPSRVRPPCAGLRSRIPLLLGLLCSSLLLPSLTSRLSWEHFLNPTHPHLGICSWET